MVNESVPYRKILPIAFALLLGLSGCGASGDRSAGGVDEVVPSQDEAAFLGAPGNADEVDLIIDLNALDAPAFDPDSVSVEVGQTASFVVTNTGRTTHEFIIGTEAYQEEHGEQVHGGHEGDLDNTVEVEPGEKGGLIWEFTQAGEVLYGCHIAGHYEAGMVGTITVQA